MNLGTLKLDHIYLMDGFKLMKQLPDSSVQLILTDPPYGISYRNNFTSLKHRMLTGDDNEGIDYETFARECFRILAENSHAYFFTRFDRYPYHYQHLKDAGFNIKNCMVLEKGTIGGLGDLYGSYANNSEWIIFAMKGRRKFEQTKLLKNKKESGKTYHKYGGLSKEYKTRFPSCWFGCDYPKVTYNASRQKQMGIYHPTAKNPECLEWLIQLSTRKEDIVLDMFSGAGSTAAAAKRTGRHYLCSEIDREYYTLSVKTLDSVSLTLF